MNDSMATIAGMMLASGQPAWRSPDATLSYIASVSVAPATGILAMASTSESCSFMTRR